MKYIISLLLLLNIFISVIPSIECHDFFCHSDNETTEIHCETCQLILPVIPSGFPQKKPIIVSKPQKINGPAEIDFQSVYLASPERPPIFTA